jgi:hypothetical protein
MKMNKGWPDAAARRSLAQKSCAAAKALLTKHGSGKSAFRAAYVRKYPIAHLFSGGPTG